MNQQMDKQLPEGWETTQLAEVADIILGQSPDGKTVNSEGKGIVFYQGKAEFGLLHPTPRNYCTNPKKIAKENDILLSVRAPVGPTNLANQETAIGRGLAAIRETQITNFKFILFYFRNIEQWLSQQGTGTTFQAISGQFIRDLPFPLPPLAEQHYLADKLDSLLTRIQTLSDQLAAVPALLKQFRQSVLADAVSGKLTVKWREETGNNDEWCSYLLKDITTKIGSGSTPKGGNSVYKTSGIPFVRSLNIYSDYIKYDDLAFIDMEQAKKLANVEIQENDVLLNITGASIGRVNIAPQAFVGGRVNQHVAIIRVKAEIAIAKYLHLLLASPEVQKWVHGENYGATRQALTKNMIEMLVVQLPSIAEQTEIVRRVEALFALADNIEQQSRAAAERVALLTQSVLAKAFRGELSAQWRCEHPDLISGDNSAAALLARIQAERAATGKKSRRA